MSIEIAGFDDIDSVEVRVVSYMAGKLCVAQGMQPDQAYIIADRGARYAAEVTLTTLRQMGVIPEGGIDSELFIRTAHALMQQSGVEI